MSTEKAGSGDGDSNKTKSRFEVKLDVSNFHADDLKVHVLDRELIVSGHHEEREEGGGCLVERHFTRKYLLPDSIEEDAMTSELDANGILKVTVPTSEPPASEYRKIPIKVDPNWKMQSNPCKELAIRDPIPLWWW